MRASEIRTAILAEHEAIRGVLCAVDSLAEALASGTGEVEALRQQSLVLHRRLATHLDFEDRALVPAVREAGGEELARILAEEHEEQRELLEYILAQLGDRDRAPLLLCRTMRSFVEVVIDDMVHEESALLRDDILRDRIATNDIELG